MAGTDGGPAFPSDPATEIYLGMSMRDYFAAAALQALVQTNNWNFPEVPQGAEVMPPEIAKEAYVIADAMLAERSK